MFVTRHAGAREWAHAQGIEASLVAHLDVHLIQPGDIVLGTLPVHLAAEICIRGGRYLHLVMDVPPEKRGSELTAADMNTFGARLEEYAVQRVIA